MSKIKICNMLFLSVILIAGCRSIPLDTPDLLKTKDEMASSDLNAYPLHVLTYQVQLKKANEAFVKIDEIVANLTTNQPITLEQIGSLQRYSRIGKSSARTSDEIDAFVSSSKERTIKFDYASEKIYEIISYAVDQDDAMEQSVGDLKDVLGITNKEKIKETEGDK